MESHLLDMLFAGNKDGKSLLLLAQSQQWEHLARKWMTAGIENEQTAKDAFKLSLKAKGLQFLEKN